MKKLGLFLVFLLILYLPLTSQTWWSGRIGGNQQLIWDEDTVGVSDTLISELYNCQWWSNLAVCWIASSTGTPDIVIYPYFSPISDSLFCFPDNAVDSVVVDDKIQHIYSIAFPRMMYNKFYCISAAAHPGGKITVYAFWSY